MRGRGRAEAAARCGLVGANENSFGGGCQIQFREGGADPEGAGEAGHEAVLVHAGQHYDVQMSRALLQDLELPDPDHYVGAGAFRRPWRGSTRRCRSSGLRPRCPERWDGRAGERAVAAVTTGGN